MKCKPGDIVLARFPFTDLRTTKKRPVVIVCRQEFQSRYDDIVGLALTTAPQPESTLLLSNWKHAGLPKRTWVKPHVATFAGEFVDIRIGTIHDLDWHHLQQAMNIIFCTEIWLDHS